MIKNLATLLIFGLAYSNHAAAQELASEDNSAIYGPPGEMDQSGRFDPSFYPSGTPTRGVPTEAAPGHYRHPPRHNVPSFGKPVIVLPVPPYTTSGFQYSGSYMPRGTPLHRFNGYIVCDPPNLTRETTTEKATGATPQRMVKITSTRSLAAPSHQQPCPIYTINGELPQQKSYATTTMPSTRNAPSRQKGERQ